MGADLIRGDSALALLRLAFAGVALLTVAAGLLVALTIPIHAWDALAYGEWSRLIAEEWSLRFPDISAQTYHRPLYYGLQGGLWGIFGFHEWIGRLLSLAFAAVLFGATAWLAARGSRWTTKAAVAAVLLCLVPDVLEGLASGLTDIPLAALVALTAAIAWTERAPALRPALLGLSACLATLVKPTAIVALVALAVALVAWPRLHRRRAVRDDLLPLAAGTALGLAYHLIQARYLDLGLVDFLRAGSTGFYEDLARENRFDQLVGLQWLGPDLRPLLVFALVYSALRVAQCSHQISAIAGIAASPVLSIALPALADQESGIQSSVADIGSALGFAALCLSLVGALWCPADQEPEREWLARFSCMAVFPLAVWIMYGGYDSRLGSAAWPALVALIALTVTSALVGLARRFPAAVAVPGLAVVALAAYGYSSIDELGEERWKAYQALGLEGIFDEAQTRNIVQPQIAELVRLSRDELGADGRLVSASGHFRFYFPGRVTQGYPASCAEIRGHRVFVLLTDEGTQAYMRDVAKVPETSTYWSSCRAPRLTEIVTVPGYVMFRVEDAEVGG